MNEALKCPITGQTIISIGPRGLMKRENYAEIFFILSDGSRMRVAVSKAAKRQIKKADTDKIFQKISRGWSDNLKTKVLDAKRLKKHSDRVKALEYVGIEDRSGRIL